MALAWVESSLPAEENLALAWVESSLPVEVNLALAWVESSLPAEVNLALTFVGLTVFGLLAGKIFVLLFRFLLGLNFYHCFSIEAVLLMLLPAETVTIIQK